MNKMIVALIAGLFVSGAAFATEASAPVVASGASAAKATAHKKSHKSKKAAKAKADDDDDDSGSGENDVFDPNRPRNPVAPVEKNSAHEIDRGS